MFLFSVGNYSFYLGVKISSWEHFFHLLSRCETDTWHKNSSGYQRTAIKANWGRLEHTADDSPRHQGHPGCYQRVMGRPLRPPGVSSCWKLNLPWRKTKKDRRRQASDVNISTLKKQSNWQTLFQLLLWRLCWGHKDIVTKLHPQPVELPCSFTKLILVFFY